MPQPQEIAALEIDNAELATLLETCSDAQALKFSDGEYLFREHEKGREIYLIIKGAFNVEQTSDKSEGIPATTIASHWNEVSEPCFVGEMAYFSDGVRTASVRSAGTTYALELKPEHLEIILEQMPNFTRVLCRQFSTRLQEANEKLAQLTADEALIVRHLNLKPGETLITQNSQPNELFLLIDGELEWLRDERPAESRSFMEFIEPSAYFAGTPYSVTARATANTLVAAIANSCKEAVVKNYPNLLIGLVASTAKDS